MESLGTYVATGVVSFAVGLALRALEPKVRLVWWSPHQFLFQLQLQQPVALLTHAITIQNLGRKEAKDVEVVHKTRPDFFKLQPALDHVETTTLAGEHIVRVRTLGPKLCDFTGVALHPLSRGSRTVHPDTTDAGVSALVQRARPRFVFDRSRVRCFLADKGWSLHTPRNRGLVVEANSMSGSDAAELFAALVASPAAICFLNHRIASTCDVRKSGLHCPDSIVRRG